jgi:hypothetical protein
VALLGSLSVQSAALQSRLDQAGRLGLRHQEDSLAAAAPQLVGRLNRLHPCLLPLPMADWSMEGLGCVAPHQVEALKQGLHDDGAWRLLDWHPGQGSAVALLELVPASQRLRPRRARFAVVLQGEPLRAQSLRLLGLRGVEP